MMLTHGIDLEEDFVHAEARTEGLSVDAVRMIRRVVALKSHAQVTVECVCICVRYECVCVYVCTLCLCMYVCMHTCICIHTCFQMAQNLGLRLSQKTLPENFLS
jgi:hypothetical protein